MSAMDWNDTSADANEVIEAVEVVEQPVDAPVYSPPIQPKKDNKKLIIAIAAIVGVLLLCCILVTAFGGCATLLALMGDDSTEVSTQEDSKYLDDNDLIAIDEDQFTVEELDYIDFINSNIGEFNTYIVAIGERASQLASTNFAVADDIGWLSDASDELGSIREIADRFIHFDLASVPERFRGAHTLYVLAMQDYLTAMDHFQGAADGNNPDALDKYADYIDAATDTIIKAHIQYATARDGVAPDLSGLE
jgi:hypothetical protein